MTAGFAFFIGNTTVKDEGQILCLKLKKAENTLICR
jgi:hypothetical protein